MTEEEKQKRRDYNRRWRQSHPEYYKKYEQEHKEQRRETYRRYYQKHKEEITEAHKRWLQEHIEEEKERHRKWYESKNVPVVYQYTELDTNTLAYIGSTNNLYYRVAGRKSKSKNPFDIIYRENPDNYKLEIIKECETLKDARELEKQLIKELQPLYNKTYK